MGDRIQSLLQNRVNKTVQQAVQKTPAVTTINGLVPPSLTTLNSLLTQINQLPPPLPCQQVVHKALSEAIQLWQADPDIANNSLVILGRPVEDVAKIIKTSLQTWPTDEYFPIATDFHLGGYQRPNDPLEMNTHIRKEFTLTKASSANSSSATIPQTAEETTDDNVPTLVVITHLEQLFLRCIQGWEGIEYLQNLTTRDTSRFWVFGCNHWAWAFLDRVCQVSAYLEQPLRLPELSGDALQHWLNPLFGQALTIPDGAAASNDCAVQLALPSDQVWNSLSSASSGIGATAARLWLAALQVTESTTDGSPTDESTTDKKITTLLTEKPTLPPLKALDEMERYILHTLLIHGEMTRAHVALSLGAAERKIRSRLQVLRREGIILQRGRRLSVNPAHYPKLYSALKNNNFLIGEI